MFSLSNLNYNDTGRVFKEMERIWLNKIKLRRNKDFVSFSNLDIYIYISGREIAVLTLILIFWSIHILFNVLRNWKTKEGKACSYNCLIPVFYTMLYYFFKWIKKKENSGWNTWIFFNFQYQLVSSLGDNQNPQSN